MTDYDDTLIDMPDVDDRLEIDTETSSSELDEPPTSFEDIGHTSKTALNLRTDERKGTPHSSPEQFNRNNYFLESSEELNRPADCKGNCKSEDSGSDTSEFCEAAPTDQSTSEASSNAVAVQSSTCEILDKEGCEDNTVKSTPDKEGAYFQLHLHYVVPDNRDSSAARENFHHQTSTTSENSESCGDISVEPISDETGGQFSNTDTQTYSEDAVEQSEALLTESENSDKIQREDLRSHPEEGATSQAIVGDFSDTDTPNLGESPEFERIESQDTQSLETSEEPSADRPSSYTTTYSPEVDEVDPRCSNTEAEKENPEIKTLDDTTSSSFDCAEFVTVEELPGRTSESEELPSRNSDSEELAGRTSDSEELPDCPNDSTVDDSSSSQSSNTSSRSNSSGSFDRSDFSLVNVGLSVPESIDEVSLHLESTTDIDDMGDNVRVEEKLRQFEDGKKDEKEDTRGTYMGGNTLSEMEKQRRRNLIFDEERFEETFLKCLICREVYNDMDKLPKMLHCHHTFCMDCLFQMYRVEGEFRQSLTGVFRGGMPMTVKIQCPTCREGIIISESELRRLPNDHTIMELLCFVNQTGKNDVQYCTKHQMQPLNFFCEPCIMPVCCDCTVIDHKESKGHVVVNVDEAMKKYTPIVEQTLADIRQEKTKIVEKRAAIEAAQDDLDSTQKDLARQVRSVFDEIRAALDERERELNDASEAEIERKREVLEGHLKTLAERDTKLNTEFNELQKAKDDKDISLIFTGHKSARDALAKKVYVPTNSTKGFAVSFQFSTRADSSIKQNLANLGDIVFHS